MMEHQGLLLALPTGLAAEILSTWLVFTDRVKLDSAYCSKAVRDEFLEFIGCSECSIKSWTIDKDVKIADNFVGWAGRRGAILHRISVAYFNDVTVYGEYVKKLGSWILEARLRDVPYWAISGVSFCTNLVNLELHCKWGDELPRLPGSYKRSTFNGATCPNLKVIQVDNCEDPILLAELVKAAVNVDTLVLQNCQMHIDEDMYDHREEMKWVQCTSAAERKEHLNEQVARMAEEAADPTSVLDVISNTVTVLSISSDGSAGFSFEALDKMMARCTKLTTLGLSGFGLSHESIYDNPFLWRRLTAVNLSRNLFVAPDAILTLADVCKDTLTELLLCQYYDVTTHIVNTVLQQCTKLTTFGVHSDEGRDCICDVSLLGRCTSLSLMYEGTEAHTIAFIASIAEHCPLLEELSLFIFEEDVESSAMDVLMTKCTRLQVFNLQLAEEYGSGSYSEDDLARWRTVRPNLTVADVFSPQLKALRKLESGDMFRDL